jgi:hypothetical protein
MMMKLIFFGVQNNVACFKDKSDESVKPEF